MKAKKYFESLMVCVACLLFFTSVNNALAQSKPPTQKELDAMMKEAQKMMSNIDPEAKRIMDSMGIKMPNMKAAPQVGNRALAKAWEDEMRIVPAKDVNRIKAIPPTPTKENLSAYLKKIQTAISTKIDPAAKADTERLFAEVFATSASKVDLAAVGLWIAGMPLEGLYFMSKALENNASNADALNNYASMLTLAGAEQLAIPILQLLNQQYPSNSTVLNNLGQAWLGLGDLALAEKYLDTAILIFPMHSQANLAKAAIAESRGNTTAAADAIAKSSSTAYSSDKANKMRKMGKEMSGQHLKLPGTMPADPLGLEKFTWPDYPYGPYASVALQQEWKEFREKCNNEASAISAKAAALQREASEEINAITSTAIRQVNSGTSLAPTILPFYAEIAAKKLNYYIDDKDGGAAYRLQKQSQETAEIFKQIVELKTKMDAQHVAVTEKYDPLIGEGRPNPLEAYCAEYNEASEKYLRLANKLLQEHNAAVLDETRKRFNNEIYYMQYTMWPKQFEVAKLQAKANWLGAIADQRVEFVMPGPFCKEQDKKEEHNGKLAEFDDVACQYHSRTDLIVWEFTADCSRLTGKLKLGKLEYTRKVDMDQGKLLRASLEVSAGVSKSISKGPVSAEAKAEIKGMLEWNDKEITNWTVEATAGVSAGTNIGAADKALGGKMPEGQTNYIEKAVGKADQSIDIAGATARVGMNSGPSLEGKGLLKGISIR